jgi:integrase
VAKTKVRDRDAGNGEGGIRQRKDGRWEARVTVGFDDDGKQIRRSFYGDTREDVAVERDKALLSVRAGTYIPPTKITVGQWMGVFLEVYVRPSVRETTYGQYESVTRVHIVPALGKDKLRDLQPKDVQRFLNDEFSGAATGRALSARSVEVIYTVLHSALKQAVLEGIVARNVADYVRLPKGPAKEMKVLTRDDMLRLMETAMGDRFGPAIITLLSTGLRVGELIALQWSNVDLQAGTLSVTKNATRVSNGTGHTKIVIGDPKTKSGKRVVTIPEPILPILQQWRRQLAEERLAAGPHWQDGNLAFPGYMGAMLDRSNVRRRLQRLCREAGIEYINVHGLRHTFATRMIEEDVSARTVQEMLGHSRVEMTLNKYVHVLSDEKRKASERLARVFSNANLGRGSVGVKQPK